MNIFENIPDTLKEELFESIIEKDGVRVERIVSEGQVTPSGEWLSQKEHEWVILLEGEAEISFKDGVPNVRMNPGDYVLIESDKAHRVESTAKDRKTIWLAVHFSTR